MSEPKTEAKKAPDERGFEPCRVYFPHSQPYNAGGVNLIMLDSGRNNARYNRELAVIRATVGGVSIEMSIHGAWGPSVHSIAQ